MPPHRQAVSVGRNFPNLQPTKLYESLFILHKCNLNLARLKNLMDAVGDDIDAHEEYALLFTYYINLETVSFLEELRNGLSKSETIYSGRIKEFRKIISPILKRINQWTDLESFRSSIIAHPWRDKKGNFVVPTQDQFNVPRNWFEISILLNLMNYLWALLAAEFSLEIAEALIYISTFRVAPKAPNNYQTLNSDHIKMAQEVEDYCRRLRRSYSLKVLQYEFLDADK